MENILHMSLFRIVEDITDLAKCIMELLNIFRSTQYQFDLLPELVKEEGGQLFHHNGNKCIRHS
ncbi:hypothetical protein GIB67_015040 [Kingdonia uniflora]|uniref:Uncharacterized protein n=1 Tax=Kingdonia uniflora TaxID=39325 RepID=A0A7J7NVR7_9MAGN|nr:hypothetical protein GIB67_035548 [Kingdonia uniflora]KAF6171092.1 hypothetical protein GIB67_015040 [Kingdonia uniflora]